MGNYSIAPSHNAGGVQRSAPLPRCVTSNRCTNDNRRRMLSNARVHLLKHAPSADYNGAMDALRRCLVGMATRCSGPKHSHDATMVTQELSGRRVLRPYAIADDIAVGIAAGGIGDRAPARCTSRSSLRAHLTLTATPAGAPGRANPPTPPRRARTSTVARARRRQQATRQNARSILSNHFAAGLHN
jgi:hypothetical protein